MPSSPGSDFVPDPFADRPQARLYRTGDRARYRANGDIEYLGRLDHQVKVRGFRIELGEIEAVIRGHPDVRDAVAIVREDSPGDQRLVAYTVFEAGQTVASTDLRSYMTSYLPAYMMPSAFVALETLPLTPNGKVDRKALPPHAASNTEGTHVAPRDAMESCLVELWETLLRRRPIGVLDDFFELGGHSLLAVRVCRRLEEEFERTVPVATLFQAPTIERLAELLRREGALVPGSLPMPLQPAGDRPPFFFFSGPSMHFGDRLGPDQPVYRIVYQDLDRGETPLVRIEDMAEHSLKSIMRVQSEGPFHLGGHGLGGWVAFEVAQQLRRQGHEVALLALCESMAPGTSPYAPGSSAMRRLWQRAVYYARQSRTRGARQVLSSLLRNARRRIDRGAWPQPPEAGPINRQVYRAAAAEASRHYQPSAYPGRITCLSCTERAPWQNADPQNGWARLPPARSSSTGYPALIPVFTGSPTSRCWRAR